MSKKEDESDDNEINVIDLRDEGAESTYERRGQELGKLVDEKQKAYGDSFGKSGDVLRCFYPDGINPDQYDDMLGIVRVVDKQFRIATDRDAMGESPWNDIGGYGLLGNARVEKERAKK